MESAYPVNEEGVYIDIHGKVEVGHWLIAIGAEQHDKKFNAFSTEIIRKIVLL